ncbi:unnamed protein product [Caenorhabditis bovis]|uniref:Uncharacterized protein n=1 Tax=Caenorhabditis bovis TaxID=2654633 RepID=A0A8S1F5I7_9PELO|nr:unnamed protein product [Caenorhabditis bovis]
MDAQSYKTVWAACRAVIFGCIIIAVGLAMTILGYFDKHFSEKVEMINGTSTVTYDKLIQFQLKSMQYLGPILMGIGSFLLIIACVVTLESRDKHAQIITEESIIQKRRIMESISERSHGEFDEYDENEELLESNRYVTLDANRLAPLADVDSLTDISITHRESSCSRTKTGERSVQTSPDDEKKSEELCSNQA